jgi:ATP-dependent DNA helicase RecQ
MSIHEPLAGTRKPSAALPDASPKVSDVIRRYWGFDNLRPLQSEAIEAALAGRDSLVVLPTGGGKSLCYQVPPAITGGTDIVISPLISLMKDQVDGLRECGYPAAALHTGLDSQPRRQIEKELAAGKYRLLFVAPERAVTPWFGEIAARLNVRRFAIDEAHCISHWGHDFRPEYRQLAALRQQFSQASLHAFTATATPRVRDDVVRQLGLRDPAVLVGSFDRPNLVYRILPLVDVYAQTIEVVRRHAEEAVIIYCITRKDTENLAATLKANGIKAEAYHAGMDARERHRVQDAFAAEELNVVVATVAFGMGIDRSDVRCVLHTAMPKSIEHYQQETGRAGRDGLPAECVLLYSYASVARWEDLIRKSAAEAGAENDVAGSQIKLLEQMQRLCNTPSCRHRALLEYFGEPYAPDNCGACDVCLADVESVEDGTEAAQKILSCVARVDERFGVGHVIDVLTAAETEMIKKCRHDQLSTYGLLRELSKKRVQSMVYQLLDQGLLDRTPGDRPILQLNERSWEVLRRERDVKMIRPKQAAPAPTKVDAQSWEGVDRGLFDRLRAWRREIAHQRNVPAYIVLGDATLRSAARIRPTRSETLRQVHGIGEKRMADFGEQLLEIVRSFCDEQKLSTDEIDESALPAYVKPKLPNAVKAQAFELFRQGRSLDDVKHLTGRAPSTTCAYLAEFIAQEKPASIKPWVDDTTYRKVRDAAATVEQRLLSPIFQRLDGRVPYDTIRLVIAHLEAIESGPPDQSPR